MQQTQPDLQLPGLLAQAWLPQETCVTWAPEEREPSSPAPRAASPARKPRRDLGRASDRARESNRNGSIEVPSQRWDVGPGGPGGAPILWPLARADHRNKYRISQERST